jgi:hypothetical protein
VITRALRLAAGVAGAEAAPEQALAAAAGPAPSDAALMAELVRVEQLAVYVYARAVASGRLAPALERLAREILEHERAHARVMVGRLPALGIAPPPAPRSDAEAKAGLVLHHTGVDFARLRSERQWLRLLLGVEQVLLRNYHRAIAHLRRVTLLELCAETLASHAQHSALLGQLQSPRYARTALSTAFINGG